MPDALPATSVPISRLGDQLRTCWLAYSEVRLLKRKVELNTNFFSTIFLLYVIATDRHLMPTYCI